MQPMRAAPHSAAWKIWMIPKSSNLPMYRSMAFQAVASISIIWSLGVSGQNCQPQGLLRLDKPYRRPGRPEVPLVFCKEHNSCTCCNASHALAAMKSMSGAMSDESIPVECRKQTALFVCRACDPLVGAGLKPTVCKSFCNNWYRSCADVFFEYDPYYASLMIAPRYGQRSLISGKLQMLVSNGIDMCLQAGAEIEDGKAACWDSISGQHPSGLCESAGPNRHAGSTSKLDSDGSMLTAGAVLLLVALLPIGAALYRTSRELGARLDGKTT